MRYLLPLLKMQKAIGKKLFSFLIIAICFIFFYTPASGQQHACDPPITINVACGAPCTGPFTVLIDDIHTTSNYCLSTIPYCHYVYTGGAQYGNFAAGTGLYSDDVWSGSQAMPFSFCFYRSEERRVGTECR